MKHYATRAEQAEHLADQVAGNLKDAIESRGMAVLVVAGGSTPKQFLNSLSNREIDWSRVVVIPSDERWVSVDHPRSNDRFIRENLIINRAACASVLSLYVEGKEPKAALEELENRLSEPGVSPTVCVLGMGEDAHFASLFPGANNLIVGLDPESSSNVIDIQAPGAEEQRVSLTLALILKSENIYLLISGKTKLAALERTRLSDSALQTPVKAIMDTDSMQIHYAN